MSISPKPNKINAFMWYYEDKGSIEIYIDAQFLQGHVACHPANGIHFRIRKSSLERSIARMNRKKRP